MCLGYQNFSLIPDIIRRRIRHRIVDKSSSQGQVTQSKLIIDALD